MNAKKANWSFLLTLVSFEVIMMVIVLLFPQIMSDLFWNNLICELIFLVPILGVMLCSKEKLAEFLGFHKIKVGTLFMIPLFTFLATPLFTVANLFSQFFADNAVLNMAEVFQVGEIPFGKLFLSVAVVAPMIEEVVCRGGYYHAYKKTGSARKAMLMSAIIFGLLHMDLNQAAYAIVIGILSVLLMEASGSIWPSILMHGFINGSQILMLRLNLQINSDLLETANSMVTTDMLIYMLAIYLVLAAVATPLAWAVLIWIQNHEGRRGSLSRFWKEGAQKKDKVLTIPFVLALILWTIHMWLMA